MWVQILGTDTACQNFANLPLWYAHYDNVRNMDDYAKLPFGGWTQPLIKQYWAGAKSTLCGIEIDKNIF